MKEKDDAIIYGIKTGNTYHYIGKTIKVNKQGEINKSNVTRQYVNSDIRNVFIKNDNIQIKKIKLVPVNEWYDEKLNEVVKKYQKENHPLLNAKWMLDGKRGVWDGTNGYWYGKKRDEHTIKRLSESKYKKVVEYNYKGYLKKIWDSRKEVGVKVFKDYRIINGSAKSKIYSILDCGRILNRFSHGSYWFSYEEIYNKFNKISNYINISELENEEKKIRSEIGKKAQKNKKFIKQYSIIHHKPDGTIITYKNAKEAAYKLKTSVKTIQRICKGQIVSNKNYILKYGEKISQPHSIKYPDYTPIPIKNRNNKIIKLHTKTSYSIERIENGCVINIYIDAKHAAKKLKIPENTVYYICKYKNRKKYPHIELRYGKKIKSFKIKKMKL